MNADTPPSTPHRPAGAPGDPASKYVERAIKLRAAGRPADAVRLLKEVLNQAPRHVGALNLLGILYSDRNDPEPAAVLFREALKYDKNSPELRFHLGVTLIQLGEVNEAHAQLRKAVQARPNDPEIQSQYARSLEMIGQVDEARRRFQTLLKRFPDHRGTIFGYGELALRKGDHETARQMFELAVAKNLNPAGALNRMAEIPEGEGPTAEVDRRLAAPDLGPIDRTLLNYAAGKIALRERRADDAIRHFLAAKGPIAEFYRIERLEALHAAIREVFDDLFFQVRGEYGVDSDVPVFVLGMPRSGTTLVEQILANHPSVATAGESVALMNLANRLGMEGRDLGAFQDNVRQISEREAKALAHDHIATLRRQVTQPRPRIIDKRPHNFELLGLIALLFPKATVIHCVRNPLDTCVSGVLNEFSGRLSFTGDLAKLGHHYRAYVRLMEHWDRVLPITIHHVRYEALVENPEAEARRMVDWLGLKWDPACLDFHSSDRVVRTASRLQVKQPIFASSIGRWHDYEAHLEPLKEALGDLARPEAEYQPST